MELFNKSTSLCYRAIWFRKNNSNFIPQKKYNVCCISLDALRFYNSSSKESQVIVDCFAKLYPEITKDILCEWNISKVFLKNEKLFTYYVRLFNDYLFEYATKNKITIIVEGIQPFVRLPMKCLINKPRIIKGTSSIQSFLKWTA